MSMNSDRRDAMRRTFEARGISAHAAAKLAKVPYTTLNSFLRGQTRSLNGSTEKKLADALGLTVSGLYGEDYDSPPVKDVWVKGLVGAGAKVTRWDSGMGEGEGYSRVPWPIGIPMTEDLIAFEIRGDSMPPFERGDLVYLETSEALPGPEIIGKVCVVELDNGDLLIKKVRRGYTTGKYNLHSFDGRPPIEDATIVKAARVRSVVMKQ
ncbi:MAG: S24 family peptidase [Robiginitomaculum sp.]|nr:S24 family peptidase [Robiginitomaculum sp.]